MEEIKRFAEEKNLKVHIDGTRAFNTIIEQKLCPKRLGRVCDTMTISIRRGLSCPIGSLILGTAD